MMADRRKHVKIVIPALFALLLLLLVSCQFTDNLEADRRQREEIAARLGVEPSWKAIKDYLEQAFVPGMSRQEVYDILDQVGSYKKAEEKKTWNSEREQHLYMLSILFTDSNIYKGLQYGDYVFWFDEQGNLVNWINFYDDL